MTKPNDDVITEAWERYHGFLQNLCDGTEIPDPPPAYIRGWKDGYEHARRTMARPDYPQPGSVQRKTL